MSQRIHPTKIWCGPGSEGIGAYWVARVEHALMLRCEGMSLDEIATRLGCGKTQAGHLVRHASLNFNWALRRAKFRTVK